MKIRLAIIGAGGHGKVAADIAQLNGYSSIVFWDDAWPDKVRIGNWAVVGKPNSDGSDDVFCAIGDNLTRAQFFNEFNLQDSLQLIHPHSTISSFSDVGCGVLVAAHAVINVGTKIGIGAIVNTACSIDHDCVIGDFVHISPGVSIAGGVRIGECSWIGIGATIIEGITIGKGAVIGAGATVIRDVEDGDRVVGTPARKL